MVVRIVARKILMIVVGEDDGEDGAVDGGEDGDKERTDKMHLQRVEILRSWHLNLRMTTPSEMILRGSSKSKWSEFFEKKGDPVWGNA